MPSEEIKSSDLQENNVKIESQDTGSTSEIGTNAAVSNTSLANVDVAPSDIPGCSSVTPDVSEAGSSSAVAGCSSRVEDEDEKSFNEKKDEAYSLLAQGNKCLLTHDYESAVNILGSACEKFVSLYGALAYECGDVHLSYGSACLEFGRQESVLFDNLQTTAATNGDVTANGNGEGGDSSCDDEDDNGENGVQQDDVEGENGDTEVDVDTIVENENDPDADENNSDADDVNEESKKAEPESFELAWETLDVAKFIFQKQGNTEKLVDTLIKLGEVSIASESYDVAIKDLQEALEFQEKSTNGEHNRKTAEIHFHLSLAYNLSGQFDEAIKEISAAKEILSKRIDKLKLEGGDKQTDEIEEITLILSDLDKQLADINVSKEEASAAKETLKSYLTCEDNESTSKSKSNTIAKTGNPDDISHLVRKKAKPVVDGQSSSTSETGESISSTNSENCLKKQAEEDIDEDKVVKKAKIET